MGVKFTGIAGEIYMLLWCLKFSRKLKDVNIVNRMLHRMVDDITILPSVIDPGVRFENDKLVKHNDKVEEDMLLPDDVRTMQVIQSIANSIDESIRITFDVPSNHEDGRVPILDVKVRIDETNRIEHIFYKKPVANRLGTLKTAAYSMQNKMNILTQECFRRLHNTSDFVENDIKLSILNDFMKDLKLSGYNERDRENILIGGIQTYSKLKQKEKMNIRPFYRSREEQMKSNKNKYHKIKNWFKTGSNANNYKTVMFVDATPEDKLLKMLKDTEEKHMISEDFRVKFVSKAGVKLKSLIQRKYITSETCKDDDGNPCVIKNGEGIQTHQCKQNRVNYFAKCKSCEVEGKCKMYFGETARNLHTRSKEHYNALKNQSKSSFMFKHIKNEHSSNSNNVTFEWGLCGKFVKPLYRQLNEAININNMSMNNVLNTKSEYFHTDVKRIKLNNKNREYQCNYCGRVVETSNELEKHLTDNHQQFTCIHCSYKSFGEIDMKYHTTAKHQINS